jgi:hypothetical protein
MTDWIFRILMTGALVIIAAQMYILTITPQPIVACVNGYIMEQHKDMWVQRGLMPAHCVQVDKD